MAPTLVTAVESHHPVRWFLLQPQEGMAVGVEGRKLPKGSVLEQRYRVTGQLGQGGFGTVYSGIDQRLKRPVAIKVLELHEKADPSAEERFVQEAQAVGAIRHANVVEMYDMGTLRSGAPFMVLEHLDGHTLQREMERGPMSPPRVKALMRGALEGLGCVHAAGIVHKDLKPENLFVVKPRSRFEMLKVFDFGVAVLLEADSRLTRAGQIFCTPAYVAPEYIQRREVSPATDVYQMGLILAELLLGKTLLTGSIQKLLSRHLGGELGIPTAVKQGAFGAVVGKATALDPKKRFENALEMLDALDAVKLNRSQLIVLPDDPTLTGDDVPLAQKPSAPKVSADDEETFPDVSVFLRQPVGTLPNEPTTKNRAVPAGLPQAVAASPKPVDIDQEETLHDIGEAELVMLLSTPKPAPDEVSVEKIAPPHGQASQTLLGGGDLDPTVEFDRSSLQGLPIPQSAARIATPQPNGADERTWIWPVLVAALALMVVLLGALVIVLLLGA